MKILILNAGSSSQKSCLYNLEGVLPDTPPEAIWEASIDWTHHDGFAEIRVKPQHGQVLEEEIAATSRPKIIAHMLETLWSGETPVLKSPSEVDVIGHRVVHGGAEYRHSTIINDEVKEAIAKLATYLS